MTSIGTITAAAIPPGDIPELSSELVLFEVFYVLPFPLFPPFVLLGLGVGFGVGEGVGLPLTI